jgi:hypothetical protein
MPQQAGFGKFPFIAIPPQLSFEITNFPLSTPFSALRHCAPAFVKPISREIMRNWSERMVSDFRDIKGTRKRLNTLSAREKSLSHKKSLRFT